MPPRRSRAASQVEGWWVATESAAAEAHVALLTAVAVGDFADKGGTVCLA